MATIFGEKKPWCKLRMMVTLMEVKGHQRSYGVNYVPWYHIWSKETLMQADNEDDLDEGQRSSEVKWGELCAMATIFGQRKRWCKLRMTMTLMEVKGHQRLNGVNYVTWLPLFGQKKRWCKLRMMMTLMEVKGHQRSNGVNYVILPPYLVKRRACQIPLLSIHFWNVQWAIPPSVPCRLVAHFMTTVLICFSSKPKTNTSKTHFLAADVTISPSFPQSHHLYTSSQLSTDIRALWSTDALVILWMCSVKRIRACVINLLELGLSTKCTDCRLGSVF